MRRTPLACLLGAAFLPALALHVPALAQVSGSAAVVSDYLYRGISFSKGAPVPQLTLVYDNPDGWYLAGMVSRVKLGGRDTSSAQYLSYAGYARRLASGLTWEVGIANHAFAGASGMNFREVFAGLASENLNARISYAPDYMAPGLRTVYAELNGSRPLSDALNLFAHLGYLGSLSEGAGRDAIRRSDARIGLGARLHSWDLQLAWAVAREGSSGNGAYATPSRNSDKLLLTVIYRF